MSIKVCTVHFSIKTVNTAEKCCNCTEYTAVSALPREAKTEFRPENKLQFVPSVALLPAEHWLLLHMLPGTGRCWQDGTRLSILYRLKVPCWMTCCRLGTSHSPCFAIVLTQSTVLCRKQSYYIVLVLTRRITKNAWYDRKIGHMPTNLISNT